MTRYAHRFKNALKKLQYRRAEFELIFPHVPKCAGSSLISLLQSGAEDSRCSIEIDTLDIDSISQICHRDPKHFYSVSADIFAYKCLTSNANLITAHAPISPELFDSCPRHKIWVTLLRHPVKRWISNYVYDRYKTSGSGKHSLIVSEFITSPQAEISFTYFQRFFNNNQPVSSKIEADRIVDFICEFDLVGFAENLSEFCHLLSGKIGIPLSPETKNTTPNKEKHQKLSNDRDLIALLEQKCELDLYIYEACRTRIGSFFS
jgi:hypothetical protein